MSNQDLNKIESYLNNELSDEERAAFEQAVKQNASLKKQLQEVLHTRLAVYEAGNAELKALLEKEGSAENSSIRWAVRLGIAAVAVLILFFVASNLLKELPVTADSLYASYFGEQAIIVDENRGSDVWDGTLELIDAQNYAVVIPKIQQLLTDEDFPYPMQAGLYLAQCQLKIGETEQALEQLESMPPDDPTYGTDRLWLMAMANLKLNQVERVRLLLNQLEDSNTYGLKAKEIIEKLDKLVPDP